MFVAFVRASVSAPDGKLVLAIPAGALAANTLIGIQPLTNMAHGKIGAAYRLTPEGQTFLHPVTLTFACADQDLPGTSADVLGAAAQIADGFWRWAGNAAVDTVAGQRERSAATARTRPMRLGKQTRPEHRRRQRATTSAIWFGGSGGPSGQEAAGVLSADGSTIEGIDSTIGVFAWKFTRDQQRDA